MKETKRRSKFDIALLLAFTVVVVAVTILMTVTFNNHIGDMTGGNEEYYSGYYVMITENRTSQFWRSVYEGGLKAGKESNVYVELLGDNLSRDYSKKDLMQMAIASGVDGIILEADESEETCNLINEAVENGIQVVTLYSDSAQSNRCSFVGIAGYNLGREYGNRIIKLASEQMSLHPDKKEILVDILFDANAQDSGQNIMFSGIQETVSQDSHGSSIVLNPVSVNSENSFSVESSIRSIFMDTSSAVPDIIVCPNEIDTTCVYQAVVDYNKVGLVSVLGYFDSDTILKAIDRNVISATVSIDTEQMGAFCIEALNDYRKFGATSQYYTADITMIDKGNILEYLDGGNENEN